MDRLSKENWILYTERKNSYKCCDVCDKKDRTITFSILGSVTILCKDCVNELYNKINGKINQ